MRAGHGDDGRFTSSFPVRWKRRHEISNVPWLRGKFDLRLGKTSTTSLRGSEVFEDGVDWFDWNFLTLFTVIKRVTIEGRIYPVFPLHDN